MSGPSRLNPLPHAGTISVFLLAVVTVTGLYITLFYEYGFEASYRSVTKMQGHPIQSVMRSIHRYSSAALVLTVAVHAWRIFAAKRFTGRQRRWRWASGVAALVMVWLAGVTGYWLAWDRRAAALNEVLVAVVGGTSWGATMLVDRVFGTAAGSGWTVLLVLWFAHIGLSVGIGYATYRHVRKSRLDWLPPKHWMGLMGGSLVLIAVMWPADLLGPARVGDLVTDMPLDPFVLFLLPPLLSSSAWLVLVLFAVVGVGFALLPRLLTRRDPAVVVIDEAACTGCELCVVDCPYLALEMVDRTGATAKRSVAVVDPAACVGCGICIGSCSFGAMDLPGADAVDAVDPAGMQVVVACERHVTQLGLRPRDQSADNELIVGVSCVGMFHSQAVGSLMERGATGVQIVGCPPGDCSFGIGNMVTAERLEGTRAPHVSRKWAGVAAEDFVPPGELASARRSPGAASTTSLEPESYQSVVSVGIVVLVSLAAVVAATRAPFRSSATESAIRVIVDHEPGSQLASQTGPSGTAGSSVAVVVTVNEFEVARNELARDGDRSVGIVDVPVDSGQASVRVALLESGDGGGGTGTVIYDGATTFVGGQRLVIEASDVPPAPGADEGKAVFNARTGGACNICHSVRPGDDGVGPSLAGIATRGGDRLQGLDASGYIRQSILSPDAYLVDGYRGGQMLDIYQDRLSPAELDALVAYLMTLTDDSE